MPLCAPPTHRSVDRWGVGQNLYIYKQVLPTSTCTLCQSIRLPPTNWKRAVTDWYDEVGSPHRRLPSPVLRSACSAGST